MRLVLELWAAEAVSGSCISSARQFHSAQKLDPKAMSFV